MARLEATADVVVVGAGVVGAACAYYAARAGLRVVVVDRGSVAGGTSSRGEGNVLVSDKLPGPELELTLRSLHLWHELGSTVDGFEFEAKGGLVVAATATGLGSLHQLAEAQRVVGVEAHSDVDLCAYEPHLRDDLAGGVHYPQDLQVQPMLAAARLLLAARRHGARVHQHTSVTGLPRAADGRISAVQTTSGAISTPAVVNAAGTWADDVAALAGSSVPVRPRRGFILVTEPVGELIRHKVYAAEYVANVASSASDLQTSAVVEGTRGGTVLIGASRERVGFDQTFALPVLARLAAAAVDLFPILAGVHAIRAFGVTI